MHRCNGLTAAKLDARASAIRVIFSPPMDAHVEQSRRRDDTLNNSDGEFPNSANTTASRSVWKSPGDRRPVQATTLVSQSKRRIGLARFVSFDGPGYYGRRDWDGQPSSSTVMLYVRRWSVVGRGRWRTRNVIAAASQPSVGGAIPGKSFSGY